MESDLKFDFPGAYRVGSYIGSSITSKEKLLQDLNTQSLKKK